VYRKNIRLEEGLLPPDADVVVADLWGVFLCSQYSTIHCSGHIYFPGVISILIASRDVVLHTFFTMSCLQTQSQAQHIVASLNVWHTPDRPTHHLIQHLDTVCIGVSVPSASNG
jgi:hypothetical protein